MTDWRQHSGWAIPIALALVAVILAVYAEGFVGLKFKAFDAPEVFGHLTALFLISLFLERTLEVFVTTWRGLERANLEKDVATKTGDAQKVAQVKLDTFQAETIRVAFICALVAGIAIAIAGARTIEPLLEEPPRNATQLIVFEVVDILITGGLIGGGSDGIHKLISVITDYLDATRKRVAAK